MLTNAGRNRREREREREKEDSDDGDTQEITPTKSRGCLQRRVMFFFNQNSLWEQDARDVREDEK